MPRKRVRKADGLLSTEAEVQSLLQGTGTPVSSRTRSSRLKNASHGVSNDNEKAKALAKPDNSLCIPNAKTTDDSEHKVTVTSHKKRGRKAKNSSPEKPTPDTTDISKDTIDVNTPLNVPKTGKQKRQPKEQSSTSSKFQKPLPASSVAKSTRRSARKRGCSKMATSLEEPMEIDEVVAPPHQGAAPVAQDEQEDTCAVCMCPPENPKILPKCKHKFCTDCIDQCFAKMNPICPICSEVYGDVTGDMPPGTMQTFLDPHTQLPGYEGYGCIVIQYDFPHGIQSDKHPNPGQPYYGTNRMAFLPNNAEGQKVCGLLRKSFECRLSFTVGRSATTGLNDQVIWNDVHHKTRVYGGPTAFGYPDPTYLNRVQEELAAKGIR